MSLETSSLDHKKSENKSFKNELKLRKMLCDTKSCYLTLFNDNPYNEYEEDSPNTNRPLSPVRSNSGRLVSSL